MANIGTYLQCFFSQILYKCKNTLVEVQWSRVEHPFTSLQCVPGALAKLVKIKINLSPFPFFALIFSLPFFTLAKK